MFNCLRGLKRHRCAAAKHSSNGLARPIHLNDRSAPGVWTYGQSLQARDVGSDFTFPDWGVLRARTREGGLPSTRWVSRANSLRKTALTGLEWSSVT